MDKPQVVITCEHAVNTVPPTFASLFAGYERLLESHRGYDPGALDLAMTIGCALGVPIYRSDVSRLLIDCNRSLHHRALFSHISRGLSLDMKEKVVACYYSPFRMAAEHRVARSVGERNQVLQLSIHTFIPVLNGMERRCDIGLLYDPARAQEKTACEVLRKLIGARLPDARIRRNYPYRGVADGFATYLRKRFSENLYRGVELEINQRFCEIPDAWEKMGTLIADSIRGLFDRTL